MTESAIGIIGLGRLGARIAEELVVRNRIARLLLQNRSSGKTSGCLASLRVLAHTVESGVLIDRLNNAQVAFLDAIVVCIKDSYDARQLMYSEELPDWLPRSIRTIGLLRDVAEVFDVARQLRDYSGVVFVVTNPVDVVTGLLQRLCPRASVLGLGSSLDSARFAYVLSQMSGRHITFDQCALGGEHGGGAVQLRSLWTFGENQARVPERTISRAFGASLEIGPRIFNDLGYAVHDCSSLFAQDILLGLGLENSKRLLIASIDFGEGPCGWPLETRRGERAFARKPLSRDERVKLGQCGRAQRAIVDRVLSTCGADASIYEPGTRRRPPPPRA